MIIHLPRSLNYRRRPHHPFDALRLRIYFKGRRVEYWNLIQNFLFFLFMIIAFRIGSMTLLMMINHRGIEAAMIMGASAAKIETPISTETQRIPVPRGGVFVSLDHYGELKINGQAVERVDAHLLLGEYRGYQKGQYYRRRPVTLVIDKRCNMEHVKELFAALRKNDLRHLYLVTQHAPK